jgi:hypothetical protein
MPTELSPTDLMWSDKEAAAHLGLSVVSVRRLRYRGVLPNGTFGAAVHIPRSVLCRALPRAHPSLRRPPHRPKD